MELVDLGASGLDEESNSIWVQCKGIEVADGEAPDFGKTPYLPCLGVAARPAAANDKGNAQGVVVNVAGFDGVCVGAHDPRAAKIFGKLEPGETAVFSTGDGFDSQILFKNQLLAIIVGDDMVIVVDRKKKQIVLNAEGCAVQVGGGNGILLLDETGVAGLQLQGGKAMLFGTQTIVGGKTAVTPVAMQAAGAIGATSLPSVGVFIGV
jgi:hypothetical protein